MVTYSEGRVDSAYMLLKFIFVVLPIAAGLDKFFDLLTHWEKYLAPVFPNFLNMNPATFMLGIGVAEIIVGIIVLTNTKVGATLLGLWLLGIVINIIILGNYYDIAARDFSLAICAFALAQLARSRSAINP